MQRTCENCEQAFEFVADSHSLKYCSLECELTGETRKYEHLLWPACVICGTAYDPALRFAHSGCCSPECEQQLGYTKGMMFGRQTTCAKCGAEFTEMPGQALIATPYCDDCRLDAYGLTSMRASIETAKQALEWAKPDPAVLSMMESARHASATMLPDIEHLWRSPLSSAIADIAKSASRAANMTADTRSILKAFEPLTWPGIEPRKRRPAPLPEPPAQPQTIERIEQKEPEVLHLLEKALHAGALQVRDAVRLLIKFTETQPGPKVENGEWTEAKVLTMWLEWQEAKHKITADAHARRWNISKATMYRLFGKHGLT